MSSDAILSIVALLIPSLAVFGLVVARPGWVRSRALPCGDLGPSGTESIPPAPSPGPIDRPPSRRARRHRVAVSSQTVRAVRTRRSFAATGPTGAPEALVIAASSATAGMRSGSRVTSTARRYAYVVDASGRARPRRRVLVAAGVGAVVVAAVIVAR